MRIGLNLIAIQDDVGGSRNYIHSLLDALAEHDRENEYVAFVTRHSASLVPHASSFRSVHVRLHVPWRWLRVLYENTVFPLRAGRFGLDCMHHVFASMPFGGGLPTVVTIFDVMAQVRPKDVRPLRRVYVRAMQRRFARHATILAPMSAFTAEELQKALGVPWNKLEVVPPAISSSFAPQSTASADAFRQRRRLPSKFWLVVTHNLPNKNLDRLIAAFAALRRSAPDGWSLAIRGVDPAALGEMLARERLESLVHFVPTLSQDEMPLLYSAASALVSPSLMEGGGLPVMEAMACGCPVAASDIATTREFAPNAARTFDPTSVESITEAMRDVERSPTLREQLVSAGLAATSKLRSDATAASCMNAYRRAVDHG